MKLGYLSITPLLTFLYLQIFAQSPDAVLACHYEAHGGKSIEQCMSLGIKGHISINGDDHPMELFKSPGKWFYSKFTYYGQDIAEAYDGEKGWKVNPVYGPPFPVSSTLNEIFVIEHQNELITPLINSRENGPLIKFHGLVEFDGEAFNRFDVIRENRAPEYWYLDPKTCLEYACVTEWIWNGETREVQIFFDDFRSTNGIILPYMIDMTIGISYRQLIVDDYTFNPEFDLRLLDKKRKKEMSSLEFLEGNWHVEYEAVDYQGSLKHFADFDTQIQFTSMNVLEMPIHYEISEVEDNIFIFTYDHRNTFYHVLNLDRETGLIDQFRGIFDGKVFVLDQIKTPDSGQEDERKWRIKFDPISSDTCIFSLEMSTDHGEEWLLRRKYTMVRS